MKRPGVNLSVPREEYRQVHPEGYGYSRSYERFRDFEQRLSPVMRQDHVVGDPKLDWRFRRLFRQESTDRRSQDRRDPRN